jgi:hypothetical protein
MNRAAAYHALGLLFGSVVEELTAALGDLDCAQAQLVDTLHRYTLGQTEPGELWRVRHRLDAAHRALQTTLLCLPFEALQRAPSRGA